MSICDGTTGCGTAYNVQGRTIPGKYRYSLNYRDSSGAGGVVCSDSCAAQILSDLEGYGFDVYTYNKNAYSWINVYPEGTQLRCGDYDSTYTDRIQRRYNSSTWSCMCGIQLLRYEWRCP